MRERTGRVNDNNGMPDTRRISWRTSVLTVSLVGLLKLCQITYGVRRLTETFAPDTCVHCEKRVQGMGNGSVVTVIYSDELYCTKFYLSSLPVLRVSQVVM